jgi:hypothetical protein
MKGISRTVKLLPAGGRQSVIDFIRLTNMYCLLCARHGKSNRPVYIVPLSLLELRNNSGFTSLGQRKTSSLGFMHCPALTVAVAPHPVGMSD